MKVKRPWTQLECALATLGFFIVFGTVVIAVEYFTR